MTNNQINLYWRLWTAAAKKQGWTTQNGLTTAAIIDLRHQQHHIALCCGCGRAQAPTASPARTSPLATSHFDDCPHPHSLKTLDNHQFDLIKAHFQLLANDTHLAAAVALTHPDNGDRKRLLWKIKSLAPQPYWEKVSQDKFHTTDLDSLSLKQLTDLRNTLTARAARTRAALTPLINTHFQVGDAPTPEPVLTTASAVSSEDDNIPF